MGRNIFLLSDGTGNSARKLFRTNVWRTYQALDLSGTAQVAYYDNGVGTSSFKPLALLGGTFGWGLKRNVLDLYVFLCRNYQNGDRIYGIGFSRGAFTIRVLTQFVLSQGLVKEISSDEDLRHKTRQLFREFRRGRTTRLGVATAARAVRDFFLRPFRSRTVEVERVEEIAFLGLWDTVDAYGLPIDELKTGIDRYLWPLALEDRCLDERIKKACHALALDDRRTTFHPLLWDESDEAPFPREDHTDRERLTQVWFAGSHTNVGGGYPDDGLSYVSLRWMVHEAAKRGATFKADTLAEIEAQARPYGWLYDSRAGLAAYYRYGPRRLDPPRDKQGAVIPCPKIHESVIWRMIAGTDGYVPLSLPSNLLVLTDTPSISQGGSADAQHPPTSNVQGFEAYFASLESCAQTKINVAAAKALPSPGANFTRPDERALELVWDTAWWRRIAYFAALAATPVLVALPLLPPLPNSLDVIFPLAAGLADAPTPAVRLIADFADAILPDIANPWIAGLRVNTWSVFLLVAIVGALLAWGRLLDRRVHNRARAAWDSRWRSGRARWLRERLAQRARLAVIVLAVAVVGAAAAWWRSGVPDEQTTCYVADWVEGCLDSERNLYRILSVAAATVAAISAMCWISLRWMAKRQATSEAEARSLGLLLAYRLRTWRPLVLSYRWLTGKLVPAVFALLMVVAGTFALNRSTAFLMDITGWGCVRGPPERGPGIEGDVTEVKLDISSPCHATGLQLVANETYEVRIGEAKDWRSPDIDPSIVYVSPDGFHSNWRDLPWLTLATPMRRELIHPWFKIILKVGALRSEQYVLDNPTTVITPRRTDQVFLFVNDGIVGLPWVYAWFYRHNSGKATITVKVLKTAPRKLI
jgi:uncharacterized protein (DUF2235 family)